MPSSWVSSIGFLESGAIVDHVRSTADRPQHLLLEASTGESVEMAAHYCSRNTARQIVERDVRRPLYETLMNMGPVLSQAIERPLLAWEFPDASVPSYQIRPGLSVADAYRTYIERHCGYIRAEQHAQMLGRLARASVDTEALRHRIDHLERFRGYPFVAAFLDKKLHFRFDLPAENDESNEENPPN